MLQIKGISVANALDYVTHTYGEDALAEVFAGLPQEEQRLLREGPVGTRWYPATLYTSLLKAIAECLANGDPTEAERISAFDMQRGFEGVARSLFRVGPATVMRLGSLFWRFYYNEGYPKIDTVHRGFVRLHLAGFVSPDPILCAHELLGGLITALQLSGAREVRGEHVACLHRGDSECAYEFRYR